MEYFISIAGERTGPHSQFNVIGQIRDGLLKGDEPAWRKGLDDWKPLREIEDFTGYWQPSPDQIAKAEHARHIVRTALAAPQPWLRFWARLVDYIWFLMLLGMIVNVALPKSAVVWYASAIVGGAPLPVIVLLNILPFLLFVPLEALFLARRGSTPGKALLRIQVRRLDGSLPNFKEALVRSFLVLVKGMGLCLWIIPLFAMSWCRMRLLQVGTTSWDEQTGLCVEHGEPEMWRHIVVMAIVGFILLSCLLAAQQMMEMMHAEGLPK